MTLVWPERCRLRLGGLAAWQEGGAEARSAFPPFRPSLPAPDGDPPSSCSRMKVYSESYAYGVPTALSEATRKTILDGSVRPQHRGVTAAIHDRATCLAFGCAAKPLRRGSYQIRFATGATAGDGSSRHAARVTLHPHPPRQVLGCAAMASGRGLGSAMDGIPPEGSLIPSRMPSFGCLVRCLDRDFAGVTELGIPFSLMINHEAFDTCLRNGR